MSADDSRPPDSDQTPRDEPSSPSPRRTFVLTDADGTVTRYEHFVAEDLIRVSMMDGRVIEFRPERAKRQPPRYQPLYLTDVGVTTYCYDGEGRLCSVQELGHTTTVTYTYGGIGEDQGTEGGDS